MFKKYKYYYIYGVSCDRKGIVDFIKNFFLYFFELTSKNSFYSFSNRNKVPIERDLKAYATTILMK